MSFAKKGTKLQTKHSTNPSTSKPNTSKKEIGPIIDMPKTTHSPAFNAPVEKTEIVTLAPEDNLPAEGSKRFPDGAITDELPTEPFPNPLHYRPGLQDGYDKSPMAKLWVEYTREGDLSGTNESRLSTEA